MQILMQRATQNRRTAANGVRAAVNEMRIIWFVSLSILRSMPRLTREPTCD